MRSSALFATIVLGAATAAPAEPKQEEISGRVSLKEKPGDPSAIGEPAGWIELASPTPAKHGTEFVVVGEDAGSFARLRIDAAKGKTILRKVKVFFVDGKTKTVQVDRILSTRGKRSTIVEFGGAKAIDRIVVTTEPQTSGEYVLYGSSGSDGGRPGDR